METMVIVEPLVGERSGHQPQRPQAQQAVTFGVAGSVFGRVHQEVAIGSDVGRRVIRVYGEALERLAEE
jgi:hypothetical protein